MATTVRAGLRHRANGADENADAMANKAKVGGLGGLAGGKASTKIGGRLALGEIGNQAVKPQQQQQIPNAKRQNTEAAKGENLFNSGFYWPQVLT